MYVCNVIFWKWNVKGKILRTYQITEQEKLEMENNNMYRIIGDIILLKGLNVPAEIKKVKVMKSNKKV